MQKLTARRFRTAFRKWRELSHFQNTWNFRNQFEPLDLLYLKIHQNSGI